MTKPTRTNTGAGRRFAAFSVGMLVLVQAAFPLAAAGEGGEGFNWGTVAGKVPTFVGPALLAGAIGVGCFFTAGAVCVGAALAAGGATLGVNAGANFAINSWGKRNVEGQGCIEDFSTQWLACAADSESFASNWGTYKDNFAEDKVNAQLGWMSAELALSALPASGGGWKGLTEAVGVGTGKLAESATTRAAVTAEAKALGARPADIAKAAKETLKNPALIDEAARISGKSVPETMKELTRMAQTGKSTFAPRVTSNLLGKSLEREGAGYVAKTNIWGKAWDSLGSRVATGKAPGTVKASLQAEGKFFAGTRSVFWGTKEVPSALRTLVRPTMVKGTLPAFLYATNPYTAPTPLPFCNGAADATGADWDGDGFTNLVEAQTGSNPCDPDVTPADVPGGPGSAPGADMPVVLIEPENGESFRATDSILVGTNVRLSKPGETLKLVRLSIDGREMFNEGPVGETSFAKALQYDACVVPAGTHTVTVYIYTSAMAYTPYQSAFTVLAAEGDACKGTPGEEGCTALTGVVWQTCYHGSGSTYSNADRLRSLATGPTTFNGSATDWLPAPWVLVVLIAFLAGSGYFWARGSTGARTVFFVTLGVTAFLVGWRAMTKYPGAAFILVAVALFAGWLWWQNRISLED